MSVQKCLSLLRLSTTVVISVIVIVVDRIHQAGITVAIILTSSAEIAVTVTIISVCIHINVIQLISHITLTIICQLAQLLLKFDSSIKQ